MKKKIITKVMSCLIATVIVFTLMTASFAANTSEKKALSDWLANSDNTGFDFTDTSYLDTDIVWTVFTLAKADVSAYPEYESYINSVVVNCSSTLFPANFALIYMTAIERGQNVNSIGSKDVLAALKGSDYSVQTYLSSLVFPLLAFDYVSISGCDSIKDTIISTILSAQQSDGGFPYCSADTGWGVSSDTDTTSMVLQSLAPYYKTDNAVKEAVDKALVYLDTQKFDDGSYGYMAYSSKSADSTAQAVIAMNSLDIDVGNSETALKAYIDASGAAIDYSGTANTMSSYQTLLALLSIDESAQGGALYKYNQPQTTTTAALVPTTQHTAQGNSVDIPKTGGNNCAVIVAFVGALSLGAVTLIKKRHEK